nr:hypothetical protein [uncultured Oscillibacter sp.]
MAYTYDDFLSAANSSGLMGEFSQADLDTAMKYPEFGLSILSLKKDVHAATTPEQKLLANEAANELRKSYGNYTGGSDGSRYYSAGKIPGQIDDVLDQINSYGSFSYDASAPTYENQYAAQQQALLDAILNREDFSWSKETDPLWPVYKKEYLREGERATANALAQTSAASGGRASSYAVNAATQAGDYYATKLNDIIPTLYQQAYDRYLNEYSMKLQDLGAVNTQEQLDYAKYLDSLTQYNTDRNFAYNQYLDDYSRLQSTLGALQSQDSVDYGRYLDQLTLQQQQRQEQLDQALLGAQYGDYSGLQALGVTPNNANVLASALANAGRTTPVGSGSSSSGGSKSDTSTADGLISAFQAGDHSDATIKGLLDAGYTQADIEAAGYTGDYFTKSGSSSGKPSASNGGYGTSYNTIWPRARTMFDQGRSTQDILNYLDKFSEEQLTDAGLDYIMNSLNLNGYRDAKG